MKTRGILLIIVFLLLWMNSTFARVYYGQLLCTNPNISCYKAKYRDSWESLFPEPGMRDIVKRINRNNMPVYPGMIIAVPHNLSQLSITDIAPFKTKIDPPGEKLVFVDLNKLAWGAYNDDGHLLHWGPAVGGMDFCRDIGKPCRTKTGVFFVEEKQPAQCVSNIFPIEWEGGAAMPFCMHYYRGFSLHGSFEVPGYNASHGCVRLFIDDARWLNEQFTDIGTKVVILPY